MKCYAPYLIAASALLVAFEARTAEVRSFVEIHRDDVRLSDLFSGLGPGQDCRLGDAPLPGQRITVEEDQLAAIADQFGVDWNASHQVRRVTIERPGRVASASDVLSILQPLLRSTGMRPDDSISLQEWSPVEIDQDAKLTAGEIRFDRQSGHFTAQVTSNLEAAGSKSWPVSGYVDLTVDVVMPTHVISADTLIADDDVVGRPIPRRELPPSDVTDLQLVTGTIARHRLLTGRPIQMSDIARPEAVRRGAAVLMHLSGQGLDLAMEGRSLDGGTLGSRIRVQNLVSGAVLTGSISGPNEVVIDPAGASYLTAAGFSGAARTDGSALASIPPATVALP